MSVFGRTIRIKGDVSATADLTIEGQVTGQVMCEGGVVTLADSSVIEGDVIAADITVLGRATGQLIATEVVDLRGARPRSQSPKQTENRMKTCPRIAVHPDTRVQDP